MKLPFNRLEKELNRLKKDPPRVALFSIITVIIVAVAAILIFGDGSFQIHEKHDNAFAGLFSALIAAIITLLVVNLRPKLDSQKMTSLMIGTYLFSLILLFLFFSWAIPESWGLSPTWIHIPTWTIIKWIISAALSAAIIYFVGYMTLRLMRDKSLEESLKPVSYLIFGAHVAAMVILAILVRSVTELGRSAEFLDRSVLVGAFFLLMLSMIIFGMSVVKIPIQLRIRAQRKVSVWAVLFTLFAGFVAISGYDLVLGEFVPRAEITVLYGATVAIAIALGAIFIHLLSFRLWESRTSVADKPSMALNRQLRFISILSFLIALVLFTWTAFPPHGSIIFYGSLSGAIAFLSILFILIPYKEALGETRAEKFELTIGRLKKTWDQYRESRFGMFGLIILIIVTIIAIIGPSIAPENPLDVIVPEDYLPQGPSGDHWFGTDFQDKDVWSQFLWGARVSLIVGILAAGLSAVIGTVVGITAGYFGRVSDEVLMRFTDFFLVIPWLPLMIVLIAILGRSFWVVLFVIGIVSWAPTARVVRAAVLSIKEKQYIERSIALGGSNAHIIGRHIFPNVFPLIVATSILLVAEAIYSEAFLDFFGLGDPNVVSWGWMLERAHEGSAILNWYWWWVVPPALGIILLIMSFYLIGDTLDDILNPRLKRR